MILTRLKPALALATLLAASSPALADGPCFYGPQNQCWPTMVLINPATGQPLVPGGSSSTTQPASGMNAYSGATVTATSTQVLAAASSGRAFLDLKNESTAQQIACSFGGTAALNTAGSFTIAPGGDKVWEGSFVPSDQVNCITSAGNTAPLTIGAH